MNLIELFQPSLRGRSEKAAIHIDGHVVTFGQLDALSDAAATKLRDQYGLRKGDRAAMYLGNCLELVVYYLACLKLGAIVVPMNVLYRDRELTHLVSDAEPKVLLSDCNRYEVFKPLRDRYPVLEQVFLVDGGHGDTFPFAQLTADAAPEPLPVIAVTSDDPALMLYTSGTTGRSKGALLTHHNLVSNIVALLHCWQWTERDRFVLALPLFHAHGLCNGLHGAMASGCTTHLFRRFKAEPVMQTLREQEGTLFFGVPTMYQRMLEAADHGEPIPAAVRLYVSGSAPLSPDTFTRLRRVFGHEILERYGMSETAMITSNLYASPRGQGTVGKPLPGVLVRVVKDNGTVVAGPGEAGEIQVRGPNVFKGYWKQPQRTAETFDEDWFKTGDMGRWDDEGRLIICGRTKELIISGGFNIYPQELINCLCDHPDIAEAAVVGVADPMRGELVKAYVVSTDQHLTAETVIEHCRSHLASFKVPRSVVFIDQLPRNAMGKIQVQHLPHRDRL